jgi:SAM-dependent methyltransferase
MQETHPALALFGKSVMKQAKLAAIRGLLPPTAGLACLDIGGDNGVISHFLRRDGGTWHSGDLTAEAVESIRELVGERCHLLDGDRTPFPDASFDLVVIIDFLEHIPGDRAFVAETARILSPGGTLVVNVPHRKRWSLIRPLRLLLGLTDEKHGHLRPGYSRRELADLLAPHFTLEVTRAYSRFFTEFLDAILSFVHTTVGSGKGKKSAKGVIVTGRDVKKAGGMFRVFSLAYPLFRTWSLLDRLIPFTDGHVLIVRARRATGG